MKAVEIIDWLNEKIPISLAENWDNSGLQLGNANKEIKKLGVCFQADLDTIKKAVKAETDFLITHHPLLSPTHNPLKNIINADYEIFRLLMNNNITVFSCHTNWDKAKGGIMETYAKLLKLSNTTTDGFVTTGDIPTTKTNDLNISITPTPVKSSLTFASNPRANPLTISIIPLIPAIPKPGMTKISNSSRTIPTIKMMISQCSANPSI